MGGIGEFRPIMPHSLRDKAFNIFHPLSHPGTRATKELISKCFVWPRITGVARNFNWEGPKIERSCDARLATFLVM